MTASVTDRAVERLRRQDAAAPADGAELTIAEMAERIGLSAHTLRYYERIELIEVPRDAAGHRVYGPAEYARVVFLNRLRMTGMPIRDLQRYVRLVQLGEHTAPERLAMLQAHRDSVLAQLAELRFAPEVVEFKIESYGGHCVP